MTSWLIGVTVCESPREGNWMYVRVFTSVTARGLLSRCQCTDWLLLLFPTKPLSIGLVKMFNPPLFPQLKIKDNAEAAGLFLPLKPLNPNTLNKIRLLQFTLLPNKLLIVILMDKTKDAMEDSQLVLIPMFNLLVVWILTGNIPTLLDKVEVVDLAKLDLSPQYQEPMLPVMPLSMEKLDFTKLPLLLDQYLFVLMPLLGKITKVVL